jgi:hypothetical protein
MERSSKHGFRLDDAMAAETEALVRGGHEPRVQEHREMEPAGEDQVVPDVRISGQRNSYPDPYPEYGADELELRAEIARHLRPSAFPANRQMLLAVAAEELAPTPVVDQLMRLPDGRQFENMQDVWHALGHSGETTRF